MQITLTELKQGINRLRIKGGANPEALYDLLNGHLTLANTIESRGGTILHEVIPSGCKGLCVYQEKLQTFHASSATGATANLAVNVLRHPTDSTLTLSQIHFSEPFLGYLYVVAEYSDASVHHFWLQAAKTWEANTVYKEGDVVQPTVPNGYSYKAVRVGTPLTVWAASVARAISDVVVPTVSNGYKYTVTAVTGANPASGTVEPIFPTVVGATVMEGTDVSGIDAPVDSGSSGTSSTGGGGTVNLPPEVVERYDNGVAK